MGGRLDRVLCSGALRYLLPAAPRPVHGATRSEQLVWHSPVLPWRTTGPHVLVPDLRHTPAGELRGPGGMVSLLVPVDSGVGVAVAPAAAAGGGVQVL